MRFTFNRTDDRQTSQYQLIWEVEDNLDDNICQTTWTILGNRQFQVVDNLSMKMVIKYKEADNLAKKIRPNIGRGLKILAI